MAKVAAMQQHEMLAMMKVMKLQWDIREYEVQESNGMEG